MIKAFDAPLNAPWVINEADASGKAQSFPDPPRHPAYFPVIHLRVPAAIAAGNQVQPGRTQAGFPNGRYALNFQSGTPIGRFSVDETVLDGLRHPLVVTGWQTSLVGLMAAFSRRHRPGLRRSCAHDATQSGACKQSNHQAFAQHDATMASQDVNEITMRRRRARVKWLRRETCRFLAGSLADGGLCAILARQRIRLVQMC